jgi:flagellar FliJ protein
MKRFVWRLQRVFDIRKKEEQVKRAELFALTEKLANARGELLMQQRILENIIADISKKKSVERLSEQEFFLKYSAASNEQIKKLKNKLAELELQQSKKLAEVLKLRRFNKGLEKLREEAKKRFIAEQEKLEQKELDEGANISFTRKIQGELSTIEK